MVQPSRLAQTVSVLGWYALDPAQQYLAQACMVETPAPETWSPLDHTVLVGFATLLACNDVQLLIHSLVVADPGDEALRALGVFMALFTERRPAWGSGGGRYA
jgi:hypothetical protein